MLSRNLYIHRKQFPLILAITIHKCQCLSLDTAIIDLSTDVFGDVSNPCINKINFLRSKFRKDLPQIKKSKGKKRKIQVIGIIDDGEPCGKNAKVSTSNPKKDDVIFTYEEPPNPDMLLQSYLVVQQHHCQMKEFLIVLLMFLVMGTVYFMPFHISLLGQFSGIQIT
uniref:ATP-dependent DNA helicase n=1 Tax=Amphimedon queenslandica TaxID=400682 RepID=A0A1X7UPG2_AMPQE